MAETVDRTKLGPDVLVGPTLTCLLGQQFKNLKYGDRFFYENAPDATKKTDKTALTVKQLNEINKVSLSSVLCNNLAVTTIQPNVFFIRSPARPNNNKVACSTYAQMDFTQWKTV